jgi:hypothetical protein
VLANLGQSDCLCGLGGAKCGYCTDNLTQCAGLPPGPPMSPGANGNHCMSGMCSMGCNKLVCGGCCGSDQVCHSLQPDNYACGGPNAGACSDCSMFSGAVCVNMLGTYTCQ